MVGVENDTVLPGCLQCRCGNSPASCLPKTKKNTYAQHITFCLLQFLFKFW